MWYDFSKMTITVTLIDAATGKEIDTSEVPQERLPESFDRNTTLSIGSDEWRVVKAEPTHQIDFSFTKKLSLWLRPIEYIDPNTIRYSIPTIANELPETDSIELFSDFRIELNADDWRQTEFLAMNILPTVLLEIGQIEAITTDEANKNILGYDRIYVRHLKRQQLGISFDDFCNHIGILKKGSVFIVNADLSGFIKNCFTIQSATTTYYGIVRDGLIDELYLYEQHESNPETERIVFRYNLLLVDWCSLQLFMVGGNGVA